jgi:hypothetical protein
VLRQKNVALATVGYGRTPPALSQNLPCAEAIRRRPVLLQPGHDFPAASVLHIEVL